MDDITTWQTPDGQWNAQLMSNRIARGETREEAISKLMEYNKTHSLPAGGYNCGCPGCQQFVDDFNRLNS